MDLNNIFSTNNLALNLFLMLLPILLLAAATFMQVQIHKHGKYELAFILLVFILFVIILLYIFGSFDPVYEVQNGDKITLKHAETFNDTNLSIFGALMLVLLPLDIFATQNLISLYDKK